jgi:myosin heavy subunit
MAADSSSTATTASARSIASSKAAAEISTSNHVYILSEDHSWVPARIISSSSSNEEKSGANNKAITVSIPKYKSEQEICSDGGQHAKSFDRIQIDLNDYGKCLLPLQNVDEHGHLKEVEDMVDLPFLHEAAILYNLKSRHLRGKPYTRTGDIIIAVNPYQVCTIYIVLQYLHGVDCVVVVVGLYNYYSLHFFPIHCTHLISSLI